MRELMWAAVAAVAIAAVLGYSVIQRPQADGLGGGGAASTEDVTAQLPRDQ